MNLLKKKKCISLLAIGFLIGPLTAQAQYDMQLIQSNSSIFAINDSGHAVINSDGVPQLYSPKKKGGTLQEVMYDAPATHNRFSVVGISDVGTMVGTAIRSDGTGRDGYIRQKDGTVEIFSHPKGIGLTSARGINNRGLVTGIYQESPDTGRHSFLYDPKNGTFTDLVPSEATIAQGINSRGDIVGSAVFVDDPCGGTEFGVRYGWVLEKKGTLTLFQVNGGRTSARGINDAGELVGFTQDTDTLITTSFVTEVPTNHCESITIDDSALLRGPGSRSFAQGITNSGKITLYGRDATESQNDAYILTPQ